MKTLNLVMIVKNEERCLARCLESVKELVDDIIIVDTGSSDSTKEIALSFGAKIYDFVWINDFSAARNFALSKSDSDWNLILDADEYLTQGNRDDISIFLENTQQLGAIQIKSAYMDNNNELNYAIGYMTRLIPKGISFTRKIHEQVDSDLPIVNLPLVFDHDGYLLPNKGDRNLNILLSELKDKPNDNYLLYQTAITLKNMSRYKEASDYFDKFYKQASKNLSYFKSAIIEYIYTLIETGNFEKALNIVNDIKSTFEKYSDFHFLCGVFYMRLILSDIIKYQNYLPLIEKSYLKCLKIGEVTAHQGVYGCGSFKASYNLGTWYEVSGNLGLAKKYYELSAKSYYKPAIDRLKNLH
jgi:glycosyltransferase involved in cell wall biosynthesis